MLLRQLPPELLDLIAEALFDDREESQLRLERLCSPSLFNLCLACRTLKDVAQPWILREVRMHYPSERALLLLRTLKENHSYGRHVQLLGLWNGEDVYQGSPAELSLLFSLLPNLYELFVPLFPPHALRPILQAPELPCRDTLEYVCLDGAREFGISHLFHLLSFPRLRNVHIFTFQDTGCSSSFPARLRALKLTSLGLAYCQIGQPLFEEIISHCNMLEKLVCLVPFPCPANKSSDLYARTWAGSAVSIAAPLSMVFMSSHLGRFKETLRELDIGTTHQLWKGHDGSRLDLHEFVALTHLSVSSACFFKPSEYRGQRLGFCKLLPRPVEKLEMQWGFETGIFFHMPEYEAEPMLPHDVLGDLEDHNPSHYGWILELAAAKQSGLPHLRHVRFDEQMISPNSGSVWELADWRQPEEVYEAFSRAGIALEVLYRWGREPIVI